MLTGNHTGTAWTTQRISNKTIGKAYTIIGYTIQIRSLHITGIITTHHLSRMIIRHNIYNIIWFCFFLFLLLTRSYSSQCRQSGKGINYF